MSKKALRPQSRHHVMIYDEDWEWLHQQYGPGSHASGLGVSGAIRHLVHQRVLAMKARAVGELDKMRDIQAKEAKGIPESEE